VLFFFLFIHSSFPFLHFRSQLICPLLLHLLVLIHLLSLSLHHISFLFNPFNSICKQISQLSSSCNSCTHSMPYSLLPRHAILLSSFSFSSAVHVLSLLSVGKCSVDFVLANLFSDLSLTPFHALNALSHCRSHACIRPLSSFDTPHCTLRSCLGTPPAPTHLRFPVFDRECKYTAVSLPTRNRARCIAIGETRQGKVPVLSSTPARGTVFFLSLPFPSLGKRVEQGWQGHRASPWASQGGKGTRLNAIRHIRRLGA
jgi:hypothetical protein